MSEKLKEPQAVYTVGTVTTKSDKLWRLARFGLPKGVTHNYIYFAGLKAVCKEFGVEYPVV